MSIFMLRGGATISALLLLAASAPPAWLDTKIPASWNTAGAPLPAAPLPRDAELAAGGRCASDLRPASTPEDRAAARNGWSLVGTYQTFGGTSVFLGSAGTDGMCRPNLYQAFVFVHGTFAGTLSPKLMDSRTDAALGSFTLENEHSIAATFARYVDSDALCCPHASTIVTYEIKAVNGKSVVVASTTETSANAR